MRGIRQAGYYAAVGEVDPENYGVAAPIMHSKGIAGCLRIARPVARLNDRDVPFLIELAVDAANRISAAIQER
jgi:DNA-binding IclR family transcriptional regulator